MTPEERSQRIKACLARVVEIGEGGRLRLRSVELWREQGDLLGEALALIDAERRDPRDDPSLT